MTQPPEEPPPDGEPPWQPPGPPPQPQPPPQNPYGGDTTGYYRPIDSGGMSPVVKVVLGAVLGVIGGFFLWFVAAIAFSAGGTSEDSDFLLFAALAPLVVPALLLISPVTRLWAVGLMIGTAISTIGLSSLCSAMLSSI